MKENIKKGGEKMKKRILDEGGRKYVVAQINFSDEEVYCHEILFGGIVSDFTQDCKQITLSKEMVILPYRDDMKIEEVEITKDLVLEMMEQTKKEMMKRGYSVKTISRRAK
jgi:hypothetical protein